jgi:hypothetical protein
VSAPRIFTPASFTLDSGLVDSQLEPAEINTFASSVNELRPFDDADFTSAALASWNHEMPTTSPSGEQTGISGRQPILPLFVLSLCQWLTALRTSG